MAKASSLPEKVLIERLKSGDQNAFSVIFSAYYPDMVIFANRFTSELHNSEEIVQDVFVIFWEERESIIINFSIKAYLLKILQNKCIDWYRHKRIVNDYNSFILKRTQPFEYDTDNYILHSELNEQIESALSKLPDEIAETFRMNRYRGLKYHEIASMLNVSVRTVEVRISRTLKFLRNLLKDYLVVVTGYFIFVLNNFQ